MSHEQKELVRSDKKKFRLRTSTLIFYILYLTMILVFLLAMDPVLTAVEQWLYTFEDSQPQVKSEQVFRDLFTDPDWAELYTLAGAEDTVFENKDTYAAYMQQLVGSNSLTYSETSAGLSGDKKYIVRHGSTKVATFTITSPDHEATDLVQWSLGTVEIFFTRNQSVYIHTVPGYTVSLNGVILDESYITKTVTTTVEDYLPEGLHGYRFMQLQADGFLMQPTVTVLDSQGNTVEMTYDPEQNLYYHSIDNCEISDEEYATVLAATMAYCKYMIRDISDSELKAYFDGSTDLFKSLKATDPWMQKYMMRSYSFTAETVSGFWKYSDDLWSARIELTFQVTRTNGSVKDYPVATTFFFTRDENGQWLVTDMTNVDVQKRTTLVRLTFLQDGQQLASMLADAGSTSLTLPMPQIPDGQRFVGWFTETTDEYGNKTRTLVFEPTENGTVILPEGYELEAMTLYAILEEAA